MTNQSPHCWLYVWLFIVAGAALFVLILLFSELDQPEPSHTGEAAALRVRHPPVGNPWQPCRRTRYFVFGLLFLVFDVESPSCSRGDRLRSLGAAGFIEMLLFIAVLAFGLLYAWRKGALEWA